MLTLLFTLMMLGVVGKLVSLAIRATWGITKICFTIIFLPLVLVALVVAGFVKIALPVLIVIGIVAMVAPKRI